MRGKTATGIGSGAIAAVGAALVTGGVVTGKEALCQSGLGLLLIGLACMVMHRSRCNTIRLIEHQTALAALTQQDQQEWAQRGYRAGQLDAAHSLPRHEPDGQVVPFPSARTTGSRRNGA